MAEVTIRCPHCKAELAAEEEWGGMEVCCPLCNKNFIVELPPPESRNDASNPQADAPESALPAPEEVPATFEAQCPHCHTKTAVEGGWLDREISCPTCKKIFTLKKVSGPEPPTETVVVEKQPQNTSVSGIKKILRWLGIVILVVGGATLGVMKYIDVKRQERIANSSIWFSGNTRPKIYLMYRYSEELANKCSFAAKAFKEYRNKDATQKYMRAKYESDTFFGRSSDIDAGDAYGGFSFKVTRDHVEALRFIEGLLSHREWLRMQESSSSIFRFENVPEGHYICIIYCASTDNFWWTDTTKKDGQSAGYNL